MPTIPAHSIPVAMVGAITCYVGLYHLWLHLTRPRAADLYLAWSSLMMAAYDCGAFFAYVAQSPEQASFWQRLQFSALAGLSFSFSKLVADRVGVALPTWFQRARLVLPALSLFGLVERFGLVVTRESAIRMTDSLFGRVSYQEVNLGPLFDSLVLLGPAAVIFPLLAAHRNSPEESPGRRDWWWASLIPIGGLCHDLLVSEGLVQGLYLGEYCWFAVMLLATRNLTAEIVESARVRQALRMTEQRFRTTLNALQEAVITTDVAGTIAQLNPSAERLLAVTLDEVLGAPLSHYLELTAPETQRIVPDPVRYAIGRPANPFRDLPQAVTTDGNERRLDIGGAPLTDDNGRIIGAVVVARDLTVQHHAIDTLQHAKKMESTGQLASGVAHDLNNLLTPIVSYVEILASRAKPGSEEELFLSHVQSAASRATEVTKQLLALSRKQVLDVQVLSLEEFIPRVEPHIRQLVGEAVEVVISVEDPACVRVDPGQLEQVLLNLATNARDAMPNGGKLSIRSRNASPNAVSLEVTDSGAGMAQGVVARIFEPFFTTKPRGKGTGLGLASVRGIVEQHGGAIYVDSEPGEGTSFEIFLPAVEGPPTHSPVTKKMPAGVAGGTEAVLVVEDDGSVRQLIFDVLSELGYRVFLADGLAQAEEVASHEHLDLLLTDVIMPAADGPQVLKAVLQHQQVAHLYMTGHADNRLGERGFVEKGTAVLRKPFTAVELARRVRHLLDEHVPVQRRDI